MDIFELNVEIVIATTFSNRAGAQTDPDTVTLGLRGERDTAPAVYVFGANGSIVTRGLVPAGLFQTIVPGYYEALFTPPYPGVWVYRWASTGDPDTVVIGRLYVRTNPVLSVVI